MEDNKKSPEITNSKETAEIKLLAKGKKIGYLKYKEVMDTFEKIALEPEEIDEIYQKLEDSGIEIMGDKEDEDALLLVDDSEDNDPDDDIDVDKEIEESKKKGNSSS